MTNYLHNAIARLEARYNADADADAEGKLPRMDTDDLAAMMDVLTFLSASISREQGADSDEHAVNLANRIALAAAGAIRLRRRRDPEYDARLTAAAENQRR